MAYFDIHPSKFIFSSSPKELCLRILRYKLAMTVDPDLSLLEGTATITVDLQDRRSNKFLVILNKGLTVHKAEFNSKPLNFTQKTSHFKDLPGFRVNMVKIRIDQHTPFKSPAILSLSYQGRLQSYQNVFSYLKDRIWEKFTLIRLDSFAYPTIAPSPEFKMLVPFIVSQKFHFNLHINVPSDLVAASFGDLYMKKKSGQWTTYSYRSKTPNWRIDIAIADYVRISNDKAKIYIYAFKDDSKHADRIMDEIERVRDFYTRWFGPPPEWAGYTVIEIPEGYGSQANPEGILLTSDAFTNPERVDSLYHEIAHLWTVKSGEKYISRFFDEGLASYMQLLAIKHLIGEGRFEAKLKEIRERFRQMAKNRPELLEVPIADYGKHSLTDASYLIGTFILYNLHLKIGDEKLRKLVRKLIEIGNREGVTFNHLKKLLKEIGEEKFLDKWIYGTKPAQLLT